MPEALCRVDRRTRNPLCVPVEHAAVALNCSTAMHKATLIILVLVALACVTRPAPHSRVEAELQTPRTEGPCPPAPLIDSSWRTVIDDTGEYELKLPVAMEASKPGKYAFVHGGQAWEGEDLTVSISFGHWAEYSFAEVEGARCYLSRDGVSVFVIASPTEVHAWYVLSPGSHEPLVRAVSKSLGSDRLAGIALSLHRRRDAV